MNYAQLSQAIADLMHRTDLSASIPTFISLAEAELNRDLRVRQMEVDLALTSITDNMITLATDIVDVKSLWVPGFEGTPLEPNGFDAVLANGLTGRPTMYARKGAKGVFFNGSGDVKGVVFQKIPGLGDSTPENWLLDEHPDVYLYGSLKQAAIYAKDDITVYDAQYAGALAGVTGTSKRITGSMRIRTR
jgi:hypothetical protein